MDIQKNIFKEVIQKLGNFNIDKDEDSENYNLILMEDIRNYIIKNAPKGLEVEYTVDVI